MYCTPVALSTYVHSVSSSADHTSCICFIYFGCSRVLLIHFKRALLLWIRTLKIDNIFSPQTSSIIWLGISRGSALHLYPFIYKMLFCLAFQKVKIELLNGRPTIIFMVTRNSCVINPNVPLGLE